jgi:hypothetical protein
MLQSCGAPNVIPDHADSADNRLHRLAGTQGSSDHWSGAFGQSSPGCRNSEHILAAVDAWEHQLQLANNHAVSPQAIAAFRVGTSQLLSRCWVVEQGKSQARSRWHRRPVEPFMSIPYQAILLPVQVAMQAGQQRLFVPPIVMTIARDRVIVDSKGSPATVYWCRVNQPSASPPPFDPKGGKGQLVDIKV